MFPSWGKGTSDMQFICGLKPEFPIPCLYCSGELSLCWNFTRRPLRCFLLVFSFFTVSFIIIECMHVCMVYLRVCVPETSEENFLGLELSFHSGFQKPNSCFQPWATSALAWSAMSPASTEVLSGFQSLAWFSSFFSTFPQVSKTPLYFPTAFYPFSGSASQETQLVTEKVPLQFP